MKKHLCLGGPLDKQLIDWDTAKVNEYYQFNSACGGSRSKFNLERLLRQGIISSRKEKIYLCFCKGLYSRVWYGNHGKRQFTGSNNF